MKSVVGWNAKGNGAIKSGFPDLGAACFTVTVIQRYLESEALMEH